MKLIFLALLSCSLMGQSTDDPVIKARHARAESLGIREVDLPQVCQGVMRPPPLAPFQSHPKDLKASRKRAKRKRT